MRVLILDRYRWRESGRPATVYRTKFVVLGSWWR